MGGLGYAPVAVQCLLPTIDCGGLQNVTATLYEARQQHAEAHAHKVVQLQHTVQKDDGQQAAERHIAKLLHERADYGWADEWWCERCEGIGR